MPIICENQPTSAVNALISYFFFSENETIFHGKSKSSKIRSTFSETFSAFICSK